MKASFQGQYADVWLSRWQVDDAEAPVDSLDGQIPLFEDEDSAAWASFSLNIAVARKSLSAVPVSTSNALTLIQYVVLDRETSMYALQLLVQLPPPRRKVTLVFGSCIMVEAF